MLIFENLVRNEYFPAELPPCYSSKKLADEHLHFAKFIKNLNQRESVPLTFNGYKSEYSRRKFGIPNPYHYLKAIDTIVLNSKDIMCIFQSSEISLSCPTKKIPKKDQAYSKRSNSIADTKNELECIYQNNQYGIELDINSFFNSIYTHSIPWAIHGKNKAKATRDKTLYGNVIDLNLRSMNYGQTNGILVGNAISRIISEIILCRIDVKIKEKFPDIKCKRYVDDYYIYLNDETNIKSVISFIRTELGKYELALNENKIKICESPFLFGKPYIEEIRQSILLEPDDFLSKLIITFNKHKDISIFRYGLQVISLHNYDKKKWPQMESKLLNLWTRFPSLSNLFVDIFMQNKENVHLNYLKNTLYDIIENSFILSNHQEMIWAVWCIKIFNLKISIECIRKIIESQNDLAIIILLDIVQNSTNRKSKEFIILLSILKKELDLEDLNDDGTNGNLLWSHRWLLAYEAESYGWFNGSKFEFIKNNSFFRELDKKKINFYDPKYNHVDKKPRATKFISKEEFKAGFEELKELIAKRDIKEVNDEVLVKKSVRSTKFIEALSRMALGEYE